MNRFSDYFSNYISDELCAVLGSGEISKFTVSRSDRSLAVGLYLDSFVDFKIVETAENSIAKAMDLHKAVINPQFPQSEFDTSNIERILQYVKRDTPAANGFFDDAEAEVEDGVLTVFLKKGGKDILESQKVDKAVSLEIEKLFTIDLEVSFMEVQTFDIEKAVHEAYEEKRQEAQQKKEEEEKNVVHVPWDDLPLYKDTLKKIHGRNITEKPKNIADVASDDGYITVWGDVIKTEVRDTKRGTSKIFDFDITDYTSSMTVKMFDDKNIIDGLIAKLEDNKTLVISGGYQFDTYSNQYVLRPNAIAGIKKIEKMDDEEEKRIELHLHTSLSEMDGISAPKDIIKRAIKWGHSAIAVTDHGVVQALPEAYKTAGGKIKLILGMEGYLVDDEKYPDFMN
ncbi:MAG: PHP domain-containing protein, partial [Eubacteriales bacterium]|nr:PHP domain-containing protein [Eubacteriales bacterium]